jgi:hypothetical protein
MLHPPHPAPALDVDAGERLVELLGTLPPSERDRFKAAAVRAGEVLEWLKPSISATSRSGNQVVGEYSEIGAGELLVVVADGARRAAHTAMPVSKIGWLVREHERHVQSTPDALKVRREGGLLTIYAVDTIQQRGSTEPKGDTAVSGSVVGEVLQQKRYRDQIKAMAAAGIVPAVVVMVAAGNDGAVAVVIGHGLAFPMKELEATGTLGGRPH